MRNKWIGGGCARTPNVYTTSGVLRHGRLKQPDWFIESRSSLEPIIEAKRTTHQCVLAQDCPVNRKVFRSAQREVAKAVRQAKESWILAVAKEAEKAGKDGCVRWKCIHKLQSVQSGQRPCYNNDGSRF